MKKVFLIGNGHIDPVWLWQWQEGLAEIKATFRSALDRMNEYPDFKFTSACASYYMWIEKSDPCMFSEIQKRVSEGRWCITGGWYLQPDCNAPSGESYARSALISQRYFKQKFGKKANAGYNVDSFGHNGSLPQILRLSQMENYVFMRPQAHEKELPQNYFIWKSRDGSEVKTYRIPFYYDVFGERLDCFKKTLELAENHDEMGFYGVGNHGGGPTRQLLDWMHENLGEEYIYATPDEYFEKAKHNDLPVVTGDLQFHAKGCYSAFSQIKADNRRTENALISAEKMSALSQFLMKTPYPDYKRAWENVLFNQFHDILGGCCIKEAYEDARYFEFESRAIAERNKNFALQQISWNIDTENQSLGTPLVVFNPNAFPVTQAVHIRKDFSALTDELGCAVPVQRVRDSKTDRNFKYATVFAASVPPLGYRVYHIKDGEKCENNPFTITENSISNGKITLVFAENGELSGYYKNGENLIKSTGITLLNDEKYDTWAHGINKFDEKIETEIRGSFKIIEQGPVRATVRVTQSFGKSEIVRDYALTAGCDFCDVKTVVDFHEKHRILKFCFETGGENCICKIPFGFIERPSNGSEQPCGEWLSDGKISVATDSKYSFSAENGALSLTVLRSAIFADHYGERDEFCEFTEQGRQDFSYRISAFSSISQCEKDAQSLLDPLVFVPETFHKGKLPQIFSGFSCDCENIILTAIKKHEDSEALVLRLYECEDRDTDAQITLFGKSFKAHFNHSEIKTFIVGETVTQTDFLEENT